MSSFIVKRTLENTHKTLQQLLVRAETDAPEQVPGLRVAIEAASFFLQDHVKAMQEHQQRTQHVALREPYGRPVESRLPRANFSVCITDGDGTPAMGYTGTDFEEAMADFEAQSTRVTTGEARRVILVGPSPYAKGLVLIRASRREMKTPVMHDMEVFKKATKSLGTKKHLRK